MGLILNIILRLSIFYFLGETLLFPDDPRFAGKAIPLRNAIVVGGLSLLFPFLYFMKKRWKNYPYFFDNIYLSIFWLDMAGNSFNLYDSFYYFDLISHFHGTGALVVVLIGALGLLQIPSFVLANGIHALLEVQEYLTDVFFQTHNVRGISDTVNDLIVGVLGTLLYVSFYLLRRSRSVNLSSQKIKIR